VALLLLKLGLTPLLIGIATLVSRRWGPAIGGLLIALPLTSGPVLLFLALDQSTAFAATATEGSMAGATAVAAFCVAYGWAGRRLSWWAAFAVGCLGFVLMSVAIQPVVAGPLPLLIASAFAAPILGLRLLPPISPATEETPAPWWDLPARMALGAALVVGITGAATTLGPQLSGLLGTFPVFITVLALFTHRRDGPSQTVRLFRGVLIGMFGTIAFFVVLRLTLESYGVLVAFPVGIAVALAIQAFGLRVVRRG
jgi:uncharacterized membrane protein (GlpM family)